MKEKWLEIVEIDAIFSHQPQSLECIVPLQNKGVLLFQDSEYTIEPGFISFLQTNNKVKIIKKESSCFIIAIIQLPIQKLQDEKWENILQNIKQETTEKPKAYMLSLDTYFSIRNKLLYFDKTVQDEQIILFIIQSILIDIYLNLVLEKKHMGLSYTGYKRGAPWWLVKACNIAAKYYNLKKGYKILIRTTGRSQEHVIRQMRRFYGMTPSQYINELRLTKAQKLLLSSNIPIYDISFKVGFENPSYFSLLFKKKYGISPSEYREGYRT